MQDYIRLERYVSEVPAIVFRHVPPQAATDYLITITYGNGIEEATDPMADDGFVNVAAA